LLESCGFDGTELFRLDVETVEQRWREEAVNEKWGERALFFLKSIMETAPSCIEIAEALCDRLLADGCVGLRAGSRLRASRVNKLASLLESCGFDGTELFGLDVETVEQRWREEAVNEKWGERALFWLKGMLSPLLSTAVKRTKLNLGQSQKTKSRISFDWHKTLTVGGNENELHERAVQAVEEAAEAVGKWNVYLLSFCGEKQEERTRKAIASNPRLADIFQGRLEFTRSRTGRGGKAERARELGISFHVDDKDIIVNEFKSQFGPHSALQVGSRPGSLTVLDATRHFVDNTVLK
jgi:hypothetical protein